MTPRQQTSCRLALYKKLFFFFPFLVEPMGGIPLSNTAPTNEFGLWAQQCFHDDYRNLENSPLFLQDESSNIGNFIPTSKRYAKVKRELGPTAAPPLARRLVYAGKNLLQLSNSSQRGKDLPALLLLAVFPLDHVPYGTGVVVVITLFVLHRVHHFQLGTGALFE